MAYVSQSAEVDQFLREIKAEFRKQNLCLWLMAIVGVSSQAILIAALILRRR